jgi:hypothetical protein
MSEDLDEQLPRQELLIKILNMTTSDNDNTALVAIRRANEFLAKQKWDWDKLINGKIKIAADPFANLSVPTSGPAQYSRPAAPPPRPRPAPPPRPQPTPQPPPPRQPRSPPPPPKQPEIGSTKGNIYGGWCYCCGDPVDPKAGWIFDPAKHNASAKSKWQIVCNACNDLPYPTISSTAMPRRRQMVGGAVPNVGDL